MLPCQARGLVEAPPALVVNRSVIISHKESDTPRALPGLYLYSKNTGYHYGVIITVLTYIFVKITNMERDNFQESLLKHTDDFRKMLSTPTGDWSVKGFIDVAKNIYTISVDTKVVSKIIELMIFPVLQKFAKENEFEMILSSEQNHYPDVTFITKDKEKIALDLKSTYRKNDNVVSGFTLGAFTAYFRYRDSNKNISFPYNLSLIHISEPTRPY